MKYLRFENSGFVIFPSTVTHKDVSKLLREKVVSAGFVGVDCDNNISCYGESETLKKSWLEDDAKKLRFQLERL